MTTKELAECLTRLPNDIEIKIFSKTEDLDEVGIFSKGISKPYLFVGNNLSLIPVQTDLERYDLYAKFTFEEFTGLLRLIYRHEYMIEVSGDDFILHPFFEPDSTELLSICTNGDICDLNKVKCYFEGFRVTNCFNDFNVTLTLSEEEGKRYIVVTA